MMKKLIVSLLVLAMALSAVSAAVDFSGSLTAGYAFQYNNRENEWRTHIMGDDGEDTNTTSLNLNIGDDNGLWNVTLEGAMVTDEAGEISGDITVDLAKSIAAAFGTTTDWSVDLSFYANDRLTGLRAYSMQKNLDRIRTADGGLKVALNLGYGDFFDLMIGGSPATVDDVEDSFAHLGAQEGDFMVSALVKPLDGLAVSATYVLKGDGEDSGVDTNATNNYGHGMIGASANVDLATLIGLDFSLGVGLSEKYQFEDNNNIFAAAVYGAFDPIAFEAQYGLKTYGNDRTEHFLYAGVDITAVENMLLDVYFGAYNLSEFSDSWFIGGDVGYTLSNVTYKLGIEYGGGTSYAYDDNYYATNKTAAGLWIVPSISVAF